jgi:arylsulfatase A-like enzyme
MWVHFMDVHVPYYPPQRFRKETGCHNISDFEMARLWQKLNTTPQDITDKELEQLEHLYDATVRYVDEEIGNLVETARQETNSEPIVAFTSDHGDEFRDHGGLTHSPKLYEELVHVPLLVTSPDRSPETVQIPVSLMDVGPTLLSLVGGNTEGMWGVDLRDQPDDRGVFSEVAQAPDDPNDSISRDVRVTACRTAKWTYIRDDLRGREELYDREADPGERKPLPEADIPVSVRERVSSFRQRVDKTSPELLSRDMSESVESRLENLGYLNG